MDIALFQPRARENSQQGNSKQFLNIILCLTFAVVFIKRGALQTRGKTLYHRVSPKSSAFLSLLFESEREYPEVFSALISGMVRESRGVRKPKQNKRMKCYGEVFCNPPIRTVSNPQSAPTLLHELRFGLESKSSVER